MVQHTTIALIQSVIALIVIIINASLQTMALTDLNKSNLTNEDVQYAKRILLIAIIAQFIAAVVMITVIVLILVYRNQLERYISMFVYSSLMLSGALLIVSGGLGATIAVRLQCYRSDPNVEQAWKAATITSVTGIAGALVLLLIQSFVKREKIKGMARQYLVQDAVSQKRPQLPQRTVMPVHHPPPYKRKVY